MTHATHEPTIAYFSMEIGLEPAIPTYSGGLGMLAGDSVRSAADLRVPMAAVTLAHRLGYFSQHLDREGRQTESPAPWVIGDFATPEPVSASLVLEGRRVQIAIWRYDVRGVGGHVVPVYLLDTDLPQNHDDDRRITDSLYGGDHVYRLRQEAVLGIGGVRVLRALGHRAIRRFHMNEGHAALLVAELLREEAEQQNLAATEKRVLESVRRRCVFTTHTPVAAGHDAFAGELVSRMLGDEAPFLADPIFQTHGSLNMTWLALNLSRYINGVAKRHGQVSRGMFPNADIDSITNGVHAATWVSAPFAALFDRHIPGWREDNYSLRHALAIPGDQVWEAHAAAKRRLIETVNHLTHAELDPGVLTIGFARRATAYKRADLLMSDLDRLRGIVARKGPVQVVYAGKSHPRDGEGKGMIERIHDFARQLSGQVRVVYLDNYDFALGRLMVSGVDLWLNTPQPPLEASGTSGMKAAVNGVPSLSVLDGWWLEGCLEGVTGWAIGQDESRAADPHERARAAASLYDKLEHAILPIFYESRSRWCDLMRHAIAVNGSYFNTQRMISEYVTRAYGCCPA